MMALKLIVLTWMLSLNLKVKQKLLKKRRLKLEIEETILDPEKNPIPPYKGEESQEENLSQSIKEPRILPVDEKININTKELSRDLVGAAFDIAHLVNKKIRVATQEELTNIGEPLAKIVDKYDLTKYMKYFSYVDEVRLIYATFNAVKIRAEEIKKIQVVEEH
jgi:hypothetical protein